MRRAGVKHAGVVLGVAVFVVFAVAGCGGSSSPSSSTAPKSTGRLVVSAAASLTDALQRCSPRGTRLSFAGSDELAAQIRQGLKPGVFAAANTKLPDQLYAAKLGQQPRVFATNELVIAVPADAQKVHSIDDLGGPGVKIATGSKTVPVGAYTQTVLSRLPAGERGEIEGNVKSEEPDVKGVVGKIVQGAVDAGFVYRTDVQAAGSKLRAVALPKEVQPVVQYGAQVVDPSPAASAYLDSLVGGTCQKALRAAGFGAP